MKSKLALLLIGMLSVLIGCFLFVQFHSRFPSAIFLVVGVIIEIVAVYQFVVNKISTNPMKSKLALLLIGMLSVLIGCFLFVQFHSRFPSAIFLVVGVIIEIVAVYQFLVNKITGGQKFN